MYSAELCRRPGGVPRNGEVVSDVKVQQRQTLSRHEAARFIAALAEGLGDDGKVMVRLGSSTLELSVANQVDCEFEVTVDGDEIELELELKWSISDRPSVEAAQDQSEADDLPEAESDEDEFEEDQSQGDQFQEDQSEEDKAPEEGMEGVLSEQGAAAEEKAEEGAPGEEAAGSGGAESVAAVVREESSRPRRGRRKAAAETGKPAFNGVDTAAVRAWAAANGLTVSPRGRIKDEVIEAYRAAGN
jgi:amphi-Trp domain-containing protein